MRPDEHGDSDVDAEEYKEYKRRLRIREERRAYVRREVGFTDTPGRGSYRLSRILRSGARRKTTGQVGTAKGKT